MERDLAAARTAAMANGVGVKSRLQALQIAYVLRPSGSLSVIGNDHAFSATSEISALHRSTTATLGPCTFRQIDGTHAPLRRSASAGELSVAPGALSGDEEGEEDWAPSEHRGFHF